jgi:hypothetical protein
MFFPTVVLSAATLVAVDYGFTCPLRFMFVVVRCNEQKIGISQPCKVRLSLNLETSGWYPGFNFGLKFWLLTFCGTFSIICLTFITVAPIWGKWVWTEKVLERKSWVIEVVRLNWV